MSGTCMHPDMQFAMHMGAGVEGEQMLRSPGPLRPRLTAMLRAEGYRWRDASDRLILLVGEALGGAGAYPGLLPRRRLGLRAGRGGRAWLGWRCSPCNRRRRTSPPPPAPSPAAPSARRGARPLPGPARAGAASRLGRHSAWRALRAAAGAAGGTRFGRGGGGGGGGARGAGRMRRRLPESGAAAAART